MISKREATATILHCDACSRHTRVYMNGPIDCWWFDCPEGWASYPEAEYLAEGDEPRIVLCPDHAYLTTTVRLVETILVSTATRVA